MGRRRVQSEATFIDATRKRRRLSLTLRNLHKEAYETIKYENPMVDATGRDGHMKYNKAKDISIKLKTLCENSEMITDPTQSIKYDWHDVVRMDEQGLMQTRGQVDESNTMKRIPTSTRNSLKMRKGVEIQ